MMITKEENEKMLEVIEKDWSPPLKITHNLIGGFVTILVGVDLICYNSNKEKVVNFGKW